MSERFEIRNKYERARTGKFVTQHGSIETPAFMPVATQGSVKSLSSDDLVDLDVSIILSNTYHLMLRPGIKTISKLGGLHKFMNWDLPILTDSGGFQTFSLSKLVEVSEEGVLFKSHIDGKEIFMSPELALEHQRDLGVDIAMLLDHCTSSQSDYLQIKVAMQRTHNWAIRSKTVEMPTSQSVFAIVQGGTYQDLRRESATFLKDMDFDGYAIGGLSVGESKSDMYKTVSDTNYILPEEKPRYLMGVGSPEDIVNCVNYGVDLFDCVLPTRVARNGSLFTNRGRININKSIYRNTGIPIDESCDCYTCSHYSMAYLNHLFKAKELLAYRLASIHNLRYIMLLMQRIRNQIDLGTFQKFKDNFLELYQTTDEKTRAIQKQKWSKNQSLKYHK
jgi:queuine tRNA-ribosyltransferase